MAPSAQLAAVLQALGRYLTRAQELGFLGQAPISTHVSRSLAFAEVAASVPTGLAVDLGSGAGIPGLVLASLWPHSTWVLVDSSQRRGRWLQSTVEDLGFAGRVNVLCERAEVLGRDHLRCQACLVTARGFGPPGATAECAAPFLEPGGHLLVADPPAGSPKRAERWPQNGLAALGLQLEGTKAVATLAGPTSITSIVARAPCPQQYPRKNGLPAKRPLF